MSEGPVLPNKLKEDGIEEALLEVRFLTACLPEIVLGRLADFDEWRGFSRSSLPVINLPPPLRRSDPNIQFDPLIELRSPDGVKLVRIGENVISFHRLRPYCGWSIFETELAQTIKGLFSRVDTVRVKRMGLRYVNAMSKGRHLISGIKDLQLKVSAGDADLIEDVNLNYQLRLSEEHLAMVRVAAPSFVAGPTPPESTVFVDIDVFTPQHFETMDSKHVSNWIRRAHDYEKEQFFRLIPDALLQQLTAEEQVIATQSARIRYLCLDEPAKPTIEIPLFAGDKTRAGHETSFARSGVHVSGIRLRTPVPRELTAAEEDVIYAALQGSVRLLAKGRLKR